MIWACAWPPTEKAPLESVLYCWTSVSVTLELAHGPAWSCLRLQWNYIRLGGRDTGRTVHFTVCGKFCEFCGKFCEFSGKIRYPHYVKRVTWVVLIQPSHCCIQAAACLSQRVESQRTLFGARRTTSATAGFGAGGARDPRNPKTTGRSGGPGSLPKVQPAPPDVWKVSRHDRGAGGPLL